MRINNKLVLECCCEKEYENKYNNKKITEITIFELKKIITDCIKNEIKNRD